MKNKIFTRVLCGVLALVALFAMAACGEKTPETQPQTTAPQETTPETTQQAQSAEGMTSFYMSMGETFDSQVYLNAYDNEDGTAYIEYVGAEKKVGSLDASVLQTIFAEAQKAQVIALNGTEIYEEGEASASLSIGMSDGTYYSANIGGSIPQEFATAYTAMETLFQSLTAEMPVYVPRPVIGEDVNSNILTAMHQILMVGEVPNLDGLMISNVPVNEDFAFATGLSSTKGVANGTACTPMMMTTAFSFVIVTAQNEEAAAAVAADFEQSMDWRKWVCVAPSNALIAQKGKMVLCIMGSDELYNSTAKGALESGWTEIKALENPDL